MDITQTFYDNLASQYDKLFLDWQSTTHEQAIILNRLFQDNGFDTLANSCVSIRRDPKSVTLEQWVAKIAGDVFKFLYPKAKECT